MARAAFSLPVRIGAAVLSPLLFVPVLMAIVCIFLAGGLWLWVTDKGAVDDCGRAVR